MKHENGLQKADNQTVYLHHADLFAKIPTIVQFLTRFKSFFQSIVAIAVFSFTVTDFIALDVELQTLALKNLRITTWLRGGGT